MSTRRTFARALAIAVAATLVTACGETTTAPDAPSISPNGASVKPPAYNLVGTTVALVSMPGDTVTGRFTVSPGSSETFVIDGKNAIRFPAQSICDPAVSSYGPTEWDKPCTPSTRPITISVKQYHDASGRLRADFEPALRFNPNKSVYLWLEDHSGSLSPWFKQINYCNDLGLCIDESLTDPSLRTYYERANDMHVRRVKHFSGYSIGVGRSEEF